MNAATPAPVHLLRLMARLWWLFMLRGLVALLFAALALLAPPWGLAVMLGLLAAWLALEGGTTLWHAVSDSDHFHGPWYWLDSLASLLAAGFLVFAPAEAALALVLVTGVWAVVVGLIRLLLAFRLGSLLLGLLGAVTVFFGAWLMTEPGPGLLALIWLAGLQAAVMGVLLLGLGWRLRRLARDPHHQG